MTLTVPASLVALLAVILSVATFCALVMWQLHRARRRGTWSPLTEDLLRLPGHSLRLEADALQDRLVERYVGIVGASAVLAGVWLVHDDARVRWAATVLVGARMLYVLSRVPALVERHRRVALGRECEEYVGSELNLLMRDGAFVFHDIPYRHGNIDHVVVGHDRVLVVETKGRRKPRAVGAAAHERSREARVRFDGRRLCFPDGATDQPIEQARRHAAHVREAIRRECGFECRVTPVVALPGWFVDAVPCEPDGVLVVNAKRARALRPWIGRRQDPETRRRMNRVACHLDAVARSVAPGSRRTDPDGARYHDRWMNPKVQAPMLR